MKKLLFLICALLITSCVARQPATEEPAEPPTPFEGTWREMRNNNQPVRGNTWIFRGDTVTIENRNEDITYTGTFTYNEEADPKEIDIHFEGYPVNEGIYRLSGNMLMLQLLDETSTTRATKLRRRRGYTLITCHRESGPGEETKDEER